MPREAWLKTPHEKAARGEPISCEASTCKLFATEMVGRVADRAVQVHGGNGYIADNMVEQLYRDVRVLRSYEGTSQIQEVIICEKSGCAPPEWRTSLVTAIQAFSVCRIQGGDNGL